MDTSEQDSDPTSEAALIAHWENQIEDDPLTLHFKRLKDKRYRFSTERFPFEGDVQILSVGFNRADVDAFGRALYATITVQPLDTESTFIGEHSMAYYQWTAEHSYYFNPDINRWQHERIYEPEELRQGANTNLSWVDITFLGAIVLLVICLTVVSVYTFKWSRSQIVFHSSVVEMNRQILDELRDSKEIKRD